MHVIKRITGGRKQLPTSDFHLPFSKMLLPQSSSQDIQTFRLVSSDSSRIVDSFLSLPDSTLSTHHNLVFPVYQMPIFCLLLSNTVYYTINNYIVAFLNSDPFSFIKIVPFSDLLRNNEIIPSPLPCLLSNHRFIVSDRSVFSFILLKKDKEYN